MGDVSLGSQDTALRLVDIVRKTVKREIQQSAANVQLGVVTQIDSDLGTCRVRFRDDADDISVKMGAIQPTQVGQGVRVSGPAGDLWVIDVIGNAALTGEISDNMVAPVELQVAPVGLALVVRWFGDAFADRYEVEYTDTATSIAITVQTVSTQFTIDGLTEGASYNIRVRAVSSSGGVSAWTAYPTSVTVTGYPPPSTSDGSAPSSSPQPAVTGGIGALFVEWATVPNSDLVIYEVYASLESGFTPDAANKLGETTGTFWSFRRLADGTPLPYENPTFVRIIARDADGAAPASVQGFSAPDRIGSGDFGSVENLTISDGVAPTSSPDNIVVTAGIGYLYVTWDAVPNGDEVTYEVHMSTGSVYTPTANTLVSEGKGTFAFLRKRPPGFGGGPITYETTYYIRVWAKDRDGYAPSASDPVTGTSIKAGSGDIGDGAVGTVQIQDAAITNVLIADATIGGAKIQEASITTANITDGAITNAKIGAAAVGTANIADAAIGNAQIANAAITDAKIASLNADKIQAGTINSININGGLITGATVRTAATGQRVEIAAGANSGIVYYYSGSPSELFPGFVRAGVGVTPYGNQAGFLSLFAPKVSTAGTFEGAAVELWQETGNGDQMARITGDFFLRGPLIMDNTGYFTVKTIGGTTRMQVEQTQTSIYYSNGLREFRLQPDGDAVIYENTTVLWNAGTGGISDARLKKNIRSIDPEFHALSILSAIPFTEFEYSGLDLYNRPIKGLPAGKRIGVSAQDVEAVYPQGVSRPRSDGNYLLDIPGMVNLLIGCVKALEARTRAS